MSFNLHVIQVEMTQSAILGKTIRLCEWMLQARTGTQYGFKSIDCLPSACH